jgi:hypothetical protein
MAEQPPIPGSILDRVGKLEKKKKATRTEKQIAAALTAMRRKEGDDPALEDFREELFRELRKMIRPAIAQARKGKPALLRILCRYTR